MELKATTELLEKNLRRHQRKVRLIELAVFSAFFTLCVLSAVLREASKEVVTIGGDVLGGWLAYTEVRYNHAYDVGIVIGFLGGAISGTFLMVDLLFSRFSTVTVDGYDITVYRGYHRRIYVDGTQVEPEKSWNVMDFKLPNGVKVCASFPRTPLLLCHLSFSDHNAPRDL